jgi:putative membrane protein
MLIRLIINAAALVVAAKVIPDIHLDTNGGTIALVYIALVAFVFGLVNTWIKPIATLVSLPLNLFALGLVGFIVNAAMLFLTAWVVGILQTPHILTLDRFPPTFRAEAVVAAVLGSIVISVVSSVLSLVAPD